MVKQTGPSSPSSSSSSFTSPSPPSSSSSSSSLSTIQMPSPQQEIESSLQEQMMTTNSTSTPSSSSSSFSSSFSSNQHLKDKSMTIDDTNIDGADCIMEAPVESSAIDLNLDRDPDPGHNLDIDIDIDHGNDHDHDHNHDHDEKKKRKPKSKSKKKKKKKRKGSKRKRMEDDIDIDDGNDDYIDADIDADIDDEISTEDDGEVHVLAAHSHGVDVEEMPPTGTGTGTSIHSHSIPNQVQEQDVQMQQPVVSAPLQVQGQGQVPVPHESEYDPEHDPEPEAVHTTTTTIMATSKSNPVSVQEGDALTITSLPYNKGMRITTDSDVHASASVAAAGNGGNGGIGGRNHASSATTIPTPRTTNTNTNTEKSPLTSNFISATSTKYNLPSPSPPTPPIQSQVQPSSISGPEVAIETSVAAVAAPVVPTIHPKEEASRVLKVIDALRMQMSEVVAFPTPINYSRLYHQASIAHASYIQLGQMVELGEVHRMDTDANMPMNMNVFTLDPESRSKFNSHGTSLWNMIQKHSDCFMDTPASTSASSSSSASNKMEHHRGAASGYIRSLSCRLILISKWTTRSTKETRMEMIKNHLGLNGADKGVDEGGDMNLCQNALNIPQLIRVQEQQLGRTSTGMKIRTKSEISQGRYIPIALSSELEFALKCFTRAGRAMVGHGMTAELNINRDTVGKSSAAAAATTARAASRPAVTTEAEVAAAAFDTLSLAVCAWEGLKVFHEEADTERSSSSMTMSTMDRARSEAFDALLLLPDCASKMKVDDADDDVDTTGVVCKGSVDDNEDEEHEMHMRRKYSQSSATVIFQLKLLQEFVRKLIGTSAFSSYTYTSVRKGEMDGNGSSNANSSVVVSSQKMYAVQTYLPSLARISYKHGNRLARLQEYNSAQVVLTIALGATEQCLNIMRHDMRHQSYNSSEGVKHGCHPKSNFTSSSSDNSLHIQEQEILVVTKQTLYALSLVYQSMDMYGEATKCADRIEVYVDEQRQRDDEMYSMTMSHLALSMARENSEEYAPSSIITLEGPKKQDVAEMKSRAQKAKIQARLSEASERVNLAYARIRLHLCEKCLVDSLQNAITCETETFIDAQYKIMVEYTGKVFTSYTDSFNLSSLLATTRHGDMNQKTGEAIELSKSNSKVGGMFRLLLATARSICSRRLLVTNNELGPCSDPYDPLVDMFSDRKVDQLLVRLEVLQTTFTAAKNARDSSINDPGIVQVALDKRVIRMAKDFILKLRRILHTSSKPSEPNSGSPRHDQIIFSLTPQKDVGMESLLLKAREYFTRVLSMYQGLEGCSEQTQEWCDILIEIVQMVRQNVILLEGGLPAGQCNKIIAGVMSIKALALTDCGSHGAGLKTARLAFEKDGTEIGNLVTLYRCSFCYEETSKSCEQEQDTKDRMTFSNTILELDNSLETFLSLSKLDTEDVVSLEKILEAFPAMCKISAHKSLLLLEVQKRWLDLSVRTIIFKLANESIYSLPNGGNGKNRIAVSLFAVLRPYLSGFEKLLTTYFANKSIEWQMHHFRNMRKVIEDTLDLLVLVRDKEYRTTQKKSLEFLEGAQFMKDDRQHPSCPLREEEHSIFEANGISDLIGTQNECLWVAERLWNISMHMMTIDSNSTATMDVPELVSSLLRSAHDFALISEEEVGKYLTKGHLAFEGFTGNPLHSTAYVDFSAAPISTDLCSEFSYQCLLSSVANIVDALKSSSAVLESKSGGAESPLDLSLRCLTVAMAERHTLELSQSGITEKAIIWLSLNLLIAMGNDAACSLSLTKGLLLTKLKQEIDKVEFSTKTAKSNESNPSPIDHIYFLACRAEHFNMFSSAKILFILCAKEMTKRGMNSIIESTNTIGIIRRKIIHLASSVQEVTDTFDSIDRAMKAASQNRESSSSLVPHSKEDIDYFIVEAHNRAISLIFLGDIHNAEKLLTVSLNLLPFGSTDIECFGIEIRRTYRGVIGRRGLHCGALTLSAGDLITLFEG